MEQRVEEQLQRFQRLKASVHEAVFESLRDAPRDPFADVADTDTSVRSILASHLTHGSAIGGTNGKASRSRQPEFSHRLANGPVRYNPMLSRLKVTMGAEATYNSFREALSLAETVRSGEEMAARLRVSAMRRQQQRGGEASLDARTLSDAAYDSEIEEAKVRRQVHAMSHLSSETRQRVRQQEQVAKHEENLAFFAAISLQPAVRAVIEAALDDEWMVGDGGSETQMVAKRLNEAKALNSRELYIAQEGLPALKDRAKAIMSLLANLKVESSDEWSEAWEEEIIERTRRFRESAEDLRGAAAKTRTEMEDHGVLVIQSFARRFVHRSAYHETISKKIAREKGDEDMLALEAEEERMRMEREEEERVEREAAERIEKERSERVAAEQAKRQEAERIRRLAEEEERARKQEKEKAESDEKRRKAKVDSFKAMASDGEEEEEKEEGVFRRSLSKMMGRRKSSASLKKSKSGKDLSMPAAGGEPGEVGGGAEEGSPQLTDDDVAARRAAMVGMKSKPGSRRGSRSNLEKKSVAESVFSSALNLAGKAQSAVDSLLDNPNLPKEGDEGQVVKSKTREGAAAAQQRAKDAYNALEELMKQTEPVSEDEFLMVFAEFEASQQALGDAADVEAAKVTKRAQKTAMKAKAQAEEARRAYQQVSELVESFKEKLKSSETAADYKANEEIQENLEKKKEEARSALKAAKEMEKEALECLAPNFQQVFTEPVYEPPTPGR